MGAAVQSCNQSMSGVSGAAVGSSGRVDADKAWADGDRAFARSELQIERDEAIRRGALDAGHPNANIAPVLGFAERGERGRDAYGHPYPARVVAITFGTRDEFSTSMRLVRDAVPAVPPIKTGPGGDYVYEETPTLGGWWERVVVSDWLLYAALVVLLCVYVFSLMMMGGAGKADPYARVLPAIEQVESGGDSQAVGDGGLAVGILQIHPVLVEDANRIARLRKLDTLFTLDDRTDAVKSRAMFRLVSGHYSKGQPDEVVARRWNGGPRGETKAATAGYWAKVKAAMNRGGT